MNLCRGMEVVRSPARMAASKPTGGSISRSLDEIIWSKSRSLLNHLTSSGSNSASSRASLKTGSWASAPFERYALSRSLALSRSNLSAEPKYICYPVLNKTVLLETHRAKDPARRPDRVCAVKECFGWFHVNLSLCSSVWSFGFYRYSNQCDAAMDFIFRKNLVGFFWPRSVTLWT